MSWRMSKIRKVIGALALSCLTVLLISQINWLTPFLSPVLAQEPPATPPASGLEKVAPEVQAALRSLPAGEMLTVIVTLRHQVDLAKLAANPAQLDRTARLKTVVELLRARADLSQAELKTWLAVRQAEAQVGQVTSFWIFNGLAVTATPAVILEVAARPEVLTITPNETIPAPPVIPADEGQLGVLASEPNLNLLDAPELWALGYRGQGIVVANMDTGVDVNHPGLGPKWRGGSNSWFDAYGQHPTTPTDLAGSSSGHGTRSMGIIVGGEHNGSAFGLAPEARWIAAKIFADNGTATSTGIHAGFQWLLDPDNNPATPDAPHVVNNSWTAALGCNLAFQADVQALRAAGILPIFAAGNYGPAASTSASPANYPESFAVGATTVADAIYDASSRGASACDGTIFPEVVAPGVSIHTTDRFGAYTYATGTSFAAPHAAGALALLLSAVPDLTVSEQETALLDNVMDLGISGPDNTFGRGRLDLSAALQPYSANLAVTQLASPGALLTNQLLSYTINVTNGGPALATSVTLTDTLPSGVALNFFEANQGSCDLSGPDSITCALGNLASGATATATVRVIPFNGGTLSNIVHVTSLKPDLEPENNWTTSSAQVTGQTFLPLILK